jgi:hypothetical protein
MTAMNDGQAIRETLYTATRLLASGTGALKVRLRAAFTPELMALRPEDFPWPDLGLRWGTLLDELAPDRRPQILVASWWDFELVRVAEELVDIYDQVSRRLAAAGPPHA